MIYATVIIIFLLFCIFLLTGGDPKDTVYNRIKNEEKDVK